MPTFSRIYALSDNPGGDVRYSIDNGVSWSLANAPSGTALVDIAVNPYDPMSVLVAGEDGIYISQDGCSTWTLATGSYSSTATGANFKRIHFVDGFTVFAISDINIVQSTDGGLTFGVVSTTAALYPANLGQCIYFANSAVGFAGIGDKYFITSDGGATWTAANGDLPLASGDTIYGIAASSDLNYILITSEARVWQSTDFGVTNTSVQVLTGTVGYQNVIFYLDTYTFFVLDSAGGNIYKTTDGGSSWTPFLGVFTPGGSAGDPVKFFMKNSSEGFYTPNSNGVFYSSNGGSTLNSVQAGKYWSITGIQFDCGTCPEGFTLVDGICEAVEYSEPTYTGSLLEVTDGNVNAFYGMLGLNLMPDITNLVLPIKGYGATNLVYNFKQNGGAGPIVPGIPGYAPTAYSLLSPVHSTLWGTNSPGCSTGSAGGRLNLTSVWADGIAVEEEVSFTFCINLEQSKQYLIGLAGDNKVKFYVDNNLYVDFDTPPFPTGAGITVSFNYWHVFPVTLSAGNHTIKVSGINLAGPAGFGAEIYDIDLATFQSLLCTPAGTFPSCGNTPADLEPYIVFSTKDLPGTHGNPGQTFVPDPNDPGEYVCADGSTITFCSGTAKCETTIYAPYFPCCFKLRDCQEVQDAIYTNTPLDAYLGKIIEIAEFPNVCWQLEITEDYCFDAITVTVVKEYDDCLSCIPSYKLYNCQDEEQVFYTTQSEFENYTNPSQIVTLQEYPQACWIVGVNNDDIFTPETLTVVEAYPSCAECVPVYYELTNCEDESIIYANPQDDLLDNNNLVVKIDIEDVATCYSVKKIIGWYEPLVDVTVLSGGYKDCSCCEPSPAPEPTVFTRTTQKPVKQFYHITDTNCEINTNVKFAINYYRLFNTIKNGIQNSCEGVDFDRLWIEKELSDYSRINPPGLCTVPVVVVPEECPLTPTVTCDIPTDVSGTGNLT
jgi:hypothetical protein